MHHDAPVAQASLQPALVGLDWGTSSLRACLFAADGSVIDRRTRPWGIQHLPAGGCAEAFRGVAGDWRERWPQVPVLAAGMVGSRQGWREVPYVDCPAGLDEIAAGIVAFESECGTLHLVPGVARRGGLPDMMRGEETQLVGAIAADPDRCGRAVCILPGTHSKWAWIRAARVERLTTFLTGELFAVLRDHSLLGRPAREAGAAVTDSPGAAEAFLHGVRAARDGGSAGVAGRLFSARSLHLTGDLAAADTLDYLSGLLIGEEIRGGLSDPESRGPCLLLGDPGLCGRYRIALGEFGRDDVRSLDDTGPAGLWQIATAAGLTSSAGPRTASGGPR